MIGYWILDLGSSVDAIDSRNGKSIYTLASIHPCIHSPSSSSHPDYSHGHLLPCPSWVCHSIDPSSILNFIHMPPTHPIQCLSPHPARSITHYRNTPFSPPVHLPYPPPTTPPRPRPAIPRHLRPPQPTAPAFPLGSALPTHLFPTRPRALAPTQTASSASRKALTRARRRPAMTMVTSDKWSPIAAWI